MLSHFLFLLFWLFKLSLDWYFFHTAKSSWVCTELSINRAHVYRTFCTHLTAPTTSLSTVFSCIKYKNLVLTFKSLYGLEPSYLSERFQPCTASCTLTSSATGLLALPQCKLKLLGGRLFSVAALTLWNSLPHSLCDCSDRSLFKSQLKHVYFLRCSQRAMK